MRFLDRATPTEAVGWGRFYHRGMCRTEDKIVAGDEQQGGQMMHCRSLSGAEGGNCFELALAWCSHLSAQLGAVCGDVRVNLSSVLTTP